MKKSIGSTAVRRARERIEPTGGGEYVRVRACAGVVNRLTAPGGRVLDVGAGEGNLRRFLRPDLRHRYLVLDRLSDGLGHRVVGDLTGLPFAPGSMDAVCLSDVLEHVPDDREVMREVWAAVRPGGTLVVHVPSLRETPFASIHAAQQHAEEADAQEFPHVRDGYSAAQLEELMSALPGSQISIEPSFPAAASVITDLDWFLWWQRFTPARFLTWTAIRLALRVPASRTENRSSGLLCVARRTPASR